MKPLYSLLSKQTKWFWDEQQEGAFQKAKEALQEDSLLVHYDGSKPLLLACDASQYGIGAVLSHIIDGQERPIAYASRTLNDAEINYSQLEKEGLAVVFGVTKFHNYLYGRHFQIDSDHQPLSYLFSESRGIPERASGRIQRWALTLSAYQYSIRYKPGKSLSNADALSRLPRAATVDYDGLTGDQIHLMDHLATTCVDANDIQKWTDKDVVLSQVRRYVMSGWPDSLQDGKFKPFHNRKMELSVLDGCLLWGARVVVPPKGQRLVLEELHDAHVGMSRMKALARSYVWWPLMNEQIETLVKSCTSCQSCRPSPPQAPLHPWDWPAQPWTRVHVDFAGPFQGHMFLVLVDATTKWLEVIPMQAITASKTIDILRSIFATHGLPRKLVSDNGPTFRSAEFSKFMSKNGIHHIFSSPYYPSTNGLAERNVQSFKQALRMNTHGTIQERLHKFLFKHRITPHTTTGISPAELLFGRRPRSTMDKLLPELHDRIEAQQHRQKVNHDTSKPARKFEVNDQVLVEMFNSTPHEWLTGKITKVTGPLSYHIELNNGRVIRRHVDSIKRDTRSVTETPQTIASDNSSDLYLPDISRTKLTGYYNRIIINNGAY